MSNFIQYAVWTVFLFAQCSVAFSETNRPLYNNEVFSDNPTPENHGFYFSLTTAEGKTTKEYPTSCDAFSKLWENNKNSLDVDVYDSEMSYYYSHLGNCLLSKWVDSSKLNQKDNIINKTKRAQITTVLPAGIATAISPDTLKQVMAAERKRQNLKKIWLITWPGVRLDKEKYMSKQWVRFKNTNNEQFNIVFYGSAPHPQLGKVYLIQTFYFVGNFGKYNVAHTYLLHQEKNGRFSIVRSFPN